MSYFELVLQIMLNGDLTNRLDVCGVIQFQASTSPYSVPVILQL